MKKNMEGHERNKIHQHHHECLGTSSTMHYVVFLRIYLCVKIAIFKKNRFTCIFLALASLFYFIGGTVNELV